MEEGGEDLDAQIARGYQLALNRAPSIEELRVLTEFYREAFFHYREVVQPDESSDEPRPEPAREALAVVANAIMNLDEFITRS